MHVTEEKCNVTICIRIIIDTLRLLVQLLTFFGLKNSDIDLAKLVTFKHL